MKGSELGDWGRRRRSWDRKQTGRGWVWAAATLTVLSGSAMLVVWQKVRYEGVLQVHSHLSEQHALLASDFASERTRYDRQATRAILIPKAVALGLVEPKVEDFAIVNLADPTPDHSSPILDVLVEPARAASNPNPRGPHGR